MNIIGVYGAFGWDANKSFDNGVPTWVHDSGATLFVNGRHITSISEERLSRIKYDGNYPALSIQYCLKEGNIEASDIDVVCVPSMTLDLFYKKMRAGDIEGTLRKEFPNAIVKFVSHHRCHAYASILTSPFNEGHVLTSDGSGSLLYDAHGNVIGNETNSLGYFNKEKNIFNFFISNPAINNFANFYSSYAHSIYCQKVGKEINVLDEKYRESFSGKVMGLSAYGSSNSFTRLYRSAERDYEDTPYITFRQDNISDYSPDDQAYIIQKNFEEALVELVTKLKEKKYIDDNLCLSGGAFLNVLGNTALKKQNINIHIPAFTSDVGLHFGAAAYESYLNSTLELPANQALLGKEYTAADMMDSLLHNNLKYREYSGDELYELIARRIDSGKIIGWFQGRSEFGPRALGSRSIFMSPKNKENKGILNSRVKHREYWRPFAGIIHRDKLHEYFKDNIDNPYMLYSLAVRDDKVSVIPAITHEDGTCRVQTVDVEQNEKVYKLLEKLTVPVILNTSFNDNGEPIVETPDDAIRAFNRLNIDVLVIGNFVVEKKK